MRRRWDMWKPYVPVAKRQSKAQKELRRLQKKGGSLCPVVVEGRAIAETLWGKAWCENLERYSDFQNRLPRGRAYLRNGSVLDLQIAPGEVRALVCGTEIYRVGVEVARVSEARWKAICRDCAGAIDSLVELLQGRFSKAVMERICREKTGLFPSPSEIKFSCSCPDWAYMCKHVAAVLYGIGARLDHEPELLFRLREVDEKELIVQAGAELPLAFAREPAVEHKPIAAGCRQGDPRLVLPDVAVQGIDPGLGDIRRVGYDGVKPTRRQGLGGQIQPVGRPEPDAAGHAVALRVSPGHLYGLRADVGGRHNHPWNILGDTDRDAAAASAKVENPPLGFRAAAA